LIAEKLHRNLFASTRYITSHFLQRVVHGMLSGLTEVESTALYGPSSTLVLHPPFLTVLHFRPTLLT